MFSLSLDPVQKRYENEIQKCTNTQCDVLKIRSFSYILSVSFWIAASALAKMHFVQIFFFLIHILILDKNWLWLQPKNFPLDRNEFLKRKIVDMKVHKNRFLSSLQFRLSSAIFIISQRWKKKASYHFELLCISKRVLSLFLFVVLVIKV